MPPTETPVETTTETPSASAPGDWHSFVTDDLKADPVVAGWAEKASEKDVGSLIKGYAHLSKRLGNAINLPGKDAKPEDVAALRTKLYEAGVFQAPPADPKDYGLVKPADLPAGVHWSEELGNKFAAALHKHGIPKSALADLLPLYMEAVSGQAKKLNVNFEQGVAQLKAEHGEKYDERLEMVQRMIGGIFKTQEEIDFAEATGLADHPAFLGPLLRLAPLAMQDSSFMETILRPGGEADGADVKAEYAKVMSDPTHKHYEGFRRGDKAAEQYVNELYRQAYGTEPVKIGEGVKV